MAKIQIQIDDQGAVTALNRLAAAGEDLSPVMRMIGEQLAESTKQRFAQSRDPDGNPWKPLARSTYEGIAGGKNLDKRGRLNARGTAAISGRKPLIGETGALSTTISYQLQGRDSVLIGTPMAYGFVHQFGGQRTYTIVPRGKRALAWPGGGHPVKKVVHPPLPARPFLGVSREDRDTIAAIVREMIERNWRT